MSKQSKYIALYICLIETIFFISFNNDPFYGDGIITLSRAAVPIFNSNFSHLFFQPQFDAGHTTFIPILLAGFWKLLGKSLWVSHLFIGLFSGLALLGFYKLSTLFLNKKSQWIAIVLLSISTFFVSQSAMLNSFIILLALWLWAWYFYFSNNFKVVSLLMTLLVITHLQGVFLLVIVFLFMLTQFVQNKTPLKHFVKLSFIIFLPATLVFFIWVYIHYNHTGWALSSPNYNRSFNGFVFVFKSIIMSVWRIIDYGVFILFFPFLAALFNKKTIINKNIITIAILSFLVVSILFAFTTPIYTTHRYFLFTIPFLVLGFVFYSQKQQNYGWNIIAFIMLVSGSFWIYPGKTTGDITLQYRDIFPLYKKLEKLKLKKCIYTYAPMWNKSEYTHLYKSTLCLKPLYSNKIENASYVIKGNMSGDFTKHDDSVLSKWKVITLENKSAYINLYTNPKKTNRFPVGNKTRHRKEENFIKNLKKLLK